MSYIGHIENGVVKFDEPVDLPEGTTVSVDVRDEPVVTSSSFYDEIKDLIEPMDDLPKDLSRNIDHYLYGSPKQ